jgi:glycosyltransferase involved in cell wall biosynthesis
MKYPHTGLYYYCKELTNALLHHTTPQQKLYLYTVPTIRQEFDRSVSIIPQLSRHKFIGVPTRNALLWHATFQGTNYFPFGKKIKKLYTIHDLNFLYDGAKSAWKQRRYLADVQRKIDEADAITVISKFVKDCVQQNLQVNNKPIHVIYNGCNIPKTTKRNKPIKLTTTQPFIFSIGTIVRKKNFHTLIPMLRGTGINLVIAGIDIDEQYRKEIEQLIINNQLQQQIFLLGSVTEAEKWWLMENMTAFVFPSIAEGFGLPVIEAMRTGKPVILSKYTSLPEIGSHYAHYFDSFDEDAMRQNLIKLLNEAPDYNPEQVDYALSFSWNKAAAEYWQVYESIINS